MRSMRLLRSTIVALVAGATVSCMTPRAQTAIAQALNDAANEIDGLKNDVFQLESEMDSLRVVLAKQDSTIARLAAFNNIPITRD